MLNFVASMLKEKPSSRPNIYQVLREACLMQGIEVPIKDVGHIEDIADPKLMLVDIRRKDTIRNPTKSTIAIDGT